ncbi:MAG: ankyrin repeat domain-containing protein [Spirochaetales bacterium]|nr:ankyrin repeat domain-containing protein [Spirochaetales bacterium]
MEKFFELEKVDSDLLCFDSCTDMELIGKLQDSDLFLMFPESLGQGCLSPETDCSCRIFEAVAAGYVLAHKGRMLLFIHEPSKLSGIFNGVPAVGSIGEALSYFRRERKVFESNKRLLDARRKISEAHLSFSSAGMIQAVEYGMHSETQAFLSAGFSTATETPEGLPLLNIAVRNGDVEICRLLMSYDASLNIIARDRITSPLMDAVTANNQEITRLLIEAGADLNYRNRNGQSALIVAIGSRMAEIAELLIENGADLSIKDSLGMTAAEYAKLFSLTGLYEKLSIFET